MSSLCIDFGTSSIRASYQSDKGSVAVLPLGQQAGERMLDGASIMSEIAVDLRAQCILFGEAGYAASIKGSGYVQRIPNAKLWLASPSELDRTAIPQSNLTRRALLTGLIGFAVATIRGLSAAHRMPADLKGVDARIAHPIWDESVREHANRELRRIASASMELVKFGFTNPMPFSELRRFEDKYREAQTISEVDVLEPIAAALQLVPYESNTRKLLVVVDVGAGTTDIGLFSYKVAEDRGRGSTSRDLLIPEAPAESVFSAGNLIDEELLTILRSKTKGATPSSLRNAEIGIRAIKAQLFQDGKVNALGCSVKLEELEERPALVNMAAKIRTAIEGMLIQRKELVKTLTTQARYQAPYVEVLMAGGGARLPFLRRALEQPLDREGLRASFTLPEIKGDPQIKCFEADICRLAVALGGVQSGYEAFRKEYEISWVKRKDLGKPKQTVQNFTVTTPDRLTTIAASQPSSFANLPNRSGAISVAKKDWDKRRSELGAKSKSGDADAQYQLALHLSDAPDDADRRSYSRESLRLLESAAALGHCAAALSLAERLKESSPEDALYWILVWKGLTKPAIPIALEKMLRERLGPQKSGSCEARSISILDQLEKAKAHRVPRTKQQAVIDPSRNLTTDPRESPVEVRLNKLNKLIAMFSKKGK